MNPYETTGAQGSSPSRKQFWKGFFIASAIWIVILLAVVCSGGIALLGGNPQEFVQ
jgi:hypothetical protein